MNRCTLPRKKIIRHKKAISRLFESGAAAYTYPLRMRYVILPKADATDTIKVGVSVSKKNFKRAVDRNLLKRRMREAIRLEQALLPPYHPSYSDRVVELMVMYIGKEICTYQQIHQATRLLFNQIIINDIS